MSEDSARDRMQRSQVNRVRKTIEENPESTPQQFLDAFMEFLWLHTDQAPSAKELEEFVRVEQ